MILPTGTIERGEMIILVLNIKNRWKEDGRGRLRRLRRVAGLVEAKSGVCSVMETKREPSRAPNRSCREVKGDQSKRLKFQTTKGFWYVTTRLRCDIHLFKSVVCVCVGCALIFGPF